MADKNRWRTTLLALIGGFIWCALLPAQDTTAPDREPQSQEEQAQARPQDEAVVEVIYVTARRREEPLQTTPIAVTAISPEDLEERNVTDIQEITGIAPNLKLDAVTYSSTTARTYVRGVGQDDSVVTADPGVGIYIDGVYLGRAQAALQAINDVERIEVLRGPQGTLFGRNTIGGAINIITATPDPDFGGNLMLRAGDYDLVESRLSLNLPASDRFQARLSTATVDSDGYMTNAFDGGDRNDRDLLGGRLSLRWLASDSFVGDLAVDYTEQDRKSQIGECRYTGRGSLVPLANLFGFRQACLATADDGDPFLGASDFLDTDESDATGFTLKLNWAGDKVSFLSTSAYREADSLLALDIDVTAVNYFTQIAGVGYEQFSQELQLNGGGDSVQYTAGLYYFQEEVDGAALTTTLAQFPLTPAIPALNALNSDVRSRPDNESVAAYGQASFDVGDRGSITAGLRYTEESKEISYFSRLFLTDTIAADFEQSQDFDEVTGLLSASYELSDRVFGYVSASRGFKSGGFNGRPLPGQASLETFEPEFVDAFELGLKSTVAGGKVTVNTALFYNDYQDLQLTIFQTTPAGGFASVVRNAAQATVQGAEVELRAFTGGGFQLYGHLGLIDADYDEFFADLDGAGSPSDNSDLDFKHTPPYEFGFGIQYARPVGDNSALTLQAEINGRDATPSVTANVEGTEITSYELVNARVAYDFLGGKLQLGAWGRNLTDETYTSTGLSFGDSLGYVLVFYAPPRTWGADLRWRF
ncbi:MAG TPA: TonB-dependent receptor [Thermoanaerobaculia bacterium]|nr:TonB-dependent receptor [Thermoanaerobaculia bacterium]